MNEDLLKTLYNKYGLSKTGSFDEFKTDMQDSNVQQKFFDKYGLSKTGSFEEFQADLGVQAGQDVSTQLIQAGITSGPVPVQGGLKAAPQSSTATKVQQEPSSGIQLRNSPPSLTDITNSGAVSIQQQEAQRKQEEEKKQREDLEKVIAANPNTPFAQNMQAKLNREDTVVGMLDDAITLNKIGNDLSGRQKKLEKDRNALDNTVPVDEAGINAFNEKVKGYNQERQDFIRDQTTGRKINDDILSKSKEISDHYLGTNPQLKDWYYGSFNPIETEGPNKGQLKGEAQLSPALEPLFLKWMSDNPGILKREITKEGDFRIGMGDIKSKYTERDRVRIVQQFLTDQIGKLKNSDDPKAQERINLLKAEAYAQMQRNPNELKRQKDIVAKTEARTITADDNFLEAAWKSSRNIVSAARNRLVDWGVSFLSTGKALSDIVQSPFTDINATQPSDVVMDAITDFVDAHRWVEPRYFKDDGSISFNNFPAQLAGVVTDMALLALTTKGYGAKAGNVFAPLTAAGTQFELGRQIRQAKEQGLTDKQALTYGMATALVMGALENVAPNVPMKGVESAYKLALEAASKGQTSKEITRAFVREIFVKQPVEEIGQELTQDWYNNFTQLVSNLAVDKEVFDLSNQGQQSFNTAVTTYGATVLFGLGHGLSGRVQSLAMAEFINEMDEQEYEALIADAVFKDQITEKEGKAYLKDFVELKKQAKDKVEGKESVAPGSVATEGAANAEAGGGSGENTAPASGAEQQTTTNETQKSQQGQAGQEQTGEQQNKQAGEGGTEITSGNSDSVVNGGQTQEAQVNQQNQVESDNTVTNNEPKQGDAIVTGKPVTLSFVKNPEKAPNMGNTFGQDVEPSGKYVAQNQGLVPEGWQQGTVTLKNPLVVDINEDTQVQWKRDLSQKYDGKTGKKLTDVLQREGYDGIITKHTDGTTGEIIVFNPEVSEQNTNNEPTTTESPAVPETVPTTTTGEGGVQVLAESTTPAAEPAKTESKIPESRKFNLTISGQEIGFYEDDAGNIRRQDNDAVVDSPKIKELRAIEVANAELEKQKQDIESGRISASKAVDALPSWQTKVIQALAKGKRFSNLERFFDLTDGTNIKRRFYSEKGDKLDDYVQGLSEQWGVPEEEVMQYIFDVMDGGVKKAAIDLLGSNQRLNQYDQTGLALDENGRIVEVVSDSQSTVNVQTESGANESEGYVQLQPGEDATKIQRHVLRLLDEENLDPELRKQIEADIKAGLYTKRSFTFEEVDRIANQMIAASKGDLGGEMARADIPISIQARAFELDAQQKLDGGDLIGAAASFRRASNIFSAAGATLGQAARTEGTLLTKTGIRTEIAKRLGDKLNEKVRNYPGKKKNEITKQEAIDDVRDKVNRQGKDIDELVQRVMSGAGLTKAVPKKKTADELIKEGLNELRNAGLSAVGPFQALPAVVKILKGLALKFKGNVQRMRDQFLKDYQGKDGQQLFDAALKEGEVKDVIKLEAAKQVIREHYGNDGAQSLEEKLVEAGLTEYEAKALADKAGAIFNELFKEDIQNKFKDLPVSKRTINRVLEEAKQGYLSNQKAIEILASDLKISLPNAETIALIEKYAEEMEAAQAKGGGYKGTVIERKLKELLRRSNLDDAKFYGMLMRDIFMANILSGPNTLLRSINGALWSNLLGEIIPEMVRGGFAGRSKKLGTSWIAEARKNMFGPVGLKAGFQAFNDIMRFGSVDISWAETVDLNNASALDVWFNQQGWFKSLDKAGRDAARSYMAASVGMYRMMIATDAVFKSAFTEYYAYVEAYNKALSQNGKLAGTDLQNEINRLLGMDSMAEAERRVDEEIKDGITPKSKRNLRLRQIIDEYRDNDVQVAANERAMEALMMGNTTGIIPAHARGAIATVTSYNQEDAPWRKTGAIIASLFFPIVRVPLNAVSRMYQFSPLGLMDGGLSWAKETYKDGVPGFLANNKVTSALGSFTGIGGKYVYNPKTKKTEYGSRSIEESKALMWRGAAGTVYAMLLTGLFAGLKRFDDDDDNDLLKGFNITGPGTASYTDNLKIFGDKYKAMTVEFGGAGKVEYSDMSLGMAAAVLGYYLDKHRAGKFKEDEDYPSMISSFAQGMWSTTFEYSADQMLALFGPLINGRVEVGKGDEKVSVNAFKRMGQLIAGEEPQNKQERDFMKSVGSKANAELFSNFYKQMYRLYRTWDKKPVQVSERIGGEVFKYTPDPFVNLMDKASFWQDGQLRDEFLDDYGNPVMERFELGFPFGQVDDIFNAENKDKTNYQKFRHDVAYKEPNWYNRLGYFQKVSLPRDITYDMVKDGKKAFAEWVDANYERLKVMDTDKLQEEIDDKAKDIVDDIRDKTVDREGTLPYFLVQIGKVIGDDDPDRSDIQEALSYLERIKDQISRDSYNIRKQKLEAKRK